MRYSVLILQEQVDVAPEFPVVLEQFEKWLTKHKLGTKNKFAMVTDGPWDMGRFLFGQCTVSTTNTVFCLHSLSGWLELYGQ